MRNLVAALVLILTLPKTLPALEVRVAPSDYVFLNENNRRVGIYDVMLQNIAIINDANE